MVRSMTDDRTDWASGPLVGFDTETTGVDTETARLVTACVVVIEPADAPSHPPRVTTREWLVDPGVEIPEEAVAVHGITTERARAEGIEPERALTEIAALFIEHWRPGGAPLVAYNATYDLTLFDREGRRHGLGGLDLAARRVVDPLVIDRHHDRYRKGGRKLGTVCDFYDVTLGDGAHDARNDVMAALRLAFKMARRWPREVGALDLDTLHARQAQWHAAWCLNFADYLAKEAAALERAADTLAAEEGTARHRAAVNVVAQKMRILEVKGDADAETAARLAEETRARVVDLRGGTAWPLRLAG